MMKPNTTFDLRATTKHIQEDGDQSPILLMEAINHIWMGSIWTALVSAKSEGKTKGYWATKISKHEAAA